MVKIKAKLRLSTIEGKTGTIYYCVSHKRLIRHINTNIRVQPDAWNEDAQRILPSVDDTCKMQNRIDSDMAELIQIVHELKSSEREFTADEVISRFTEPERRISVMDFFQEQIKFLTDCNKLGTAVNYKRASSTFASFLNGRNVCFSELTSCLVEDYMEYLSRKGMVRNSLSFHMRILRAVYNKAVRRGYAKQTFPFRDVYTGVDNTRKRAVGEDIILQLMCLDIGHNFSLSFARDVFLFSFYTRGMAFVDIVYLKKTDIQDGIIRYVRHKTGKELAIRIEPCMQAIIERYADMVRTTPYVFPVLKNEDSEECFRQYKLELRTYNNRLARLSRLMGLDCNLSSYTSRHSWATMARNHNVPLQVISAGMGHSSERTTQIYLTSLENTLVDSANKGLLDSFNLSLSY